MKRHVFPFGDGETVPLRIEFEADVPISEIDLPARLQWLGRELTTVLSSAEVVEILIVGQRRNSIELLIGWIEDADAEVTLDCVELVFPEAQSANLGSSAFADSSRNKDTEDAGAIDFDFVFVPATTVEFEDGRLEDVAPFWISRYPVTYGQFFEFTRKTGYMTSAERQGSYSTFRENDLIADLTGCDKQNSSVAFVSMDDARAYCEWSSTRLPSEAEWLAAFVIDWAPLESGRNITSEQKRRRDNGLVSGMAEWTSTSDSLEMNAVVRSAPKHFLTSDWKSRKGSRLCPIDHYEVVISFRVVKVGTLNIDRFTYES